MKLEMYMKLTLVSKYSLTIKQIKISNFRNLKIVSEQNVEDVFLPYSK